MIINYKNMGRRVDKSRDDEDDENYFNVQQLKSVAKHDAAASRDFEERLGGEE